MFCVDFICIWHSVLIALPSIPIYSFCCVSGASVRSFITFALCHGSHIVIIADFFFSTANHRHTLKQIIYYILHVNWCTTNQLIDFLSSCFSIPNINTLNICILRRSITSNSQSPLPHYNSQSSHRFKTQIYTIENHNRSSVIQLKLANRFEKLIISCICVHAGAS